MKYFFPQSFFMFWVCINFFGIGCTHAQIKSSERWTMHHLVATHLLPFVFLLGEVLRHVVTFQTFSWELYLQAWESSPCWHVIFLLWVICTAYKFIWLRSFHSWITFSFSFPWFLGWNFWDSASKWCDWSTRSFSRLFLGSDHVSTSIFAKICKEH